jgi:hypothetical protein
MVRKARAVSTILALLVSTGFLFAQGGATGTILGTVTDNSGAVVPKAAVTVTNTGTSVASHTQTSDTGNYTVPYLIPGTYSVSVEAPGFQKAVVDNISLVVDQQARVDAVLKPGTVTEVVEVRANPVALDTDNAAVSQLVSNRQVEDLPLNGRNWTQLLFITPGAVTVGAEMGTMRQGEGNGISINGGRPESNNYTIDGIGATDVALSTPAVILSIDAIQEFKVQSDTYSAEYGFSANQVNIISKAGTNDLHGTLFEFDRNDAFDARSPIAEPTIPKLRQNQFGFVVGGPVYLPHIYNGRNKTFFMANYEGTRISNGFTGFVNTPPPDELAGNFSGSGLPEPGTPACAAALVLNNPCNPENPATGQAFPNDTIPSTLWSRQAAVTLAANTFPAPNCSPAQCAGNNVLLSLNLPNRADQQTYRLDQDLGKFGKIFGRGTYASYKNTNLYNSDSVPYGLTSFYETEKQWAISHTLSFHGNIVNSFRMGYLDAIANEGAPAPSASQIAALGYSNVFTKFGPLQASWSGIGFGNVYSGFGGSVNAYTASDIPNWEFNDSLTIVKGKHTITTGAEFRHWVVNRNLDDDFFGDYGYDNDTILGNNNGCTTIVCGTGNQVADFLLGYYNNVGGFIPGPLSPTNQAGNPQSHVYNYFAPFVQDDWKVNPRLTLNLGLRWDYRSVPYEENNKFFWLDVNNPNGGLCFADKRLLTDGVAPAGNGFFEYCNRRAPQNPGLLDPYAPRIGFAFRPFGGDKTVVRGGYGIYYDSFEAREIDDSGDLYPYSIRDSLTPTTQPVTTAPKLTNQLFPGFTTLTKVSPASATFIAVIESELPINPYMQQWTLSVEHQLAKNTTLEVNYIGLKGTHLLDRHNIAQPYAPTNGATLCNPPTGAVANCLGAEYTSRLPYPNFTGFYIDSDWHGNSDYNAGNVKLEHRTGQMSITTIFTWAKSLDDKSAAAGLGSDGGGYQGFMDNHNMRRDYGPANYDVDHRFVTSYVYNLPFGRGKHFLSNTNKALDMALGGWELTGITTFQTGFPYSIDALDLNGILDSQNPRADRVPGVPIAPAHKTTATWINTAAFSQPLNGVYGNTGRGFLRSPGINDWDIGFFKNFNFTESKSLQLRFESFNTWNHPNYYVPLTGPAAGGACNPDCGISDVSFGALTIAAPGRIIQLGAKFIF